MTTKSQQTPSRRLRCLGAWLLWIIVLFILFLLALRFQIFPTVPEDQGFLLGILSRSLTDVFYGFLISGMIASISYGLCLLLITQHGPQTYPLLARMVGLDRVGQRQFDVENTTFNITRSPLRDAVTLFPGLGFLGTVIGVSIAIGGLEDVMSGQPPTELIAGLRTAFDTTFIGLISSLILSILLMAIDQARAQKTDAHLDSDG